MEEEEGKGEASFPVVRDCGEKEERDTAVCKAVQCSGSQIGVFSLQPREVVGQINKNITECSEGGASPCPCLWLWEGARFAPGRLTQGIALKMYQQELGGDLLCLNMDPTKEGWTSSLPGSSRILELRGD